MVQYACLFVQSVKKIYMAMFCIIHAQINIVYILLLLPNIYSCVDVLDHKCFLCQRGPGIRGNDTEPQGSCAFARWMVRFIRFINMYYICLEYRGWLKVLPLVFVLLYVHHNQVHLTHWGRDKVAASSQTTFSSAFSWMKTFESQIKFHWNMFFGV